MEAVHNFFKGALPKYLRNLPIPKTFGGFANLSGEDWSNLTPFLLSIILIFYMGSKTLFGRKKAILKPKVNHSIQKEDSKVVTQMDIEDIGDKIAFCRCWRSKKFPLCDGSHNKHNDETRDNVGPLLLRRAGDE
ncbi:CDGSH iron-sulfur domain-containing protein 2 homolog A-like [Physella acuta]|uniref:CDGSH iron-sulfur domain-containing protein 2 homolog A-like n=1 Tax=Physella acuta TaxID=109671 RepID=UPI0027DC1DB4|nr:CDGSH iron-sulfur domain-containing protein 2 homolog A-like [Physella acuta]